MATAFNHVILIYLLPSSVRIASRKGPLSGFWLNPPPRVLSHQASLSLSVSLSIMNLSRAITRVLSSHCRRSNKWLSLRQFPFAALQLAYLSADSVEPAKRTYRRTAKPKPEADPLRPVATSPAFASQKEESLDLPCPSEIPFQSKVANQVHLIGTVGVPVELQALPNGAYTAVSTLASDKTKGIHQFWYALFLNGSGAKRPF